MKRNFKKYVAVSMVMAFLTASVPATITQAASAPKLSKSKLTMTVGKSKKLTVKNAKKVTKWTSSNKKIVSVVKTGKTSAKVTGKKVGSAQVSAKVGGKVLKCKVSVKKAGSNNNTSTQVPATQISVTSTPVIQYENDWII